VRERRGKVLDFLQLPLKRRLLFLQSSRALAVLPDFRAFKLARKLRQPRTFLFNVKDGPKRPSTVRPVQ
jgi:hypothetical protein